MGLVCRCLLWVLLRRKITSVIGLGGKILTRRITGLLALSLILGVILFDLSTAQVNPYRAPPIIALGSGVASAGGFCGALPD